MKDINLSALAAEVYATKDNQIDGALIGKDAESMPLGSIDFPKLNESEIIGILGRKWRGHLDCLKSLVDLYQYLTSNKAITILHISGRSKRLIAIYKSQREISRVLVAAVRVGLLDIPHFSHHEARRNP